MHFTTLFVLKGYKLEDISVDEIENTFSERFCYCCGETQPKYEYWCDWFSIGGRWNDAKILVAPNGLKAGENGVVDDYGEPQVTVCEIKDLTEPVNRTLIYAIATKSRIYQKAKISSHNY